MEPPKAAPWRNTDALRIGWVATDYGRGPRVLSVRRGAFSVRLFDALRNPLRTTRHLRYPLKGPEGS